MAEAVATWVSKDVSLPLGQLEKCWITFTIGWGSMAESLHDVEANEPEMPRLPLVAI